MKLDNRTIQCDACKTVMSKGQECYTDHDEHGRQIKTRPLCHACYQAEIKK